MTCVELKDSPERRKIPDESQATACSFLAGFFQQNAMHHIERTAANFRTDFETIRYCHKSRISMDNRSNCETDFVLFRKLVPIPDSQPAIRLILLEERAFDGER